MKRLSKKLPDKPGVYFFRNGKKVLYIGKATSLRNRVQSYFTDDLILKRSVHIKNMVSEATRVDYQITSSALEALLLESQLIKKNQPYYNTREKDDKSYNHVVITKEEFPRVFTVRGKDLSLWKDKVKYSFGPFPQGSELKEALKIIRRIFPFRDKKSTLRTTSRFYQSIGLEPENISKSLYAKTIKNIRQLFGGKYSQILKNLSIEMERLAKSQKFEEAGQIRNQIFALKHINDVALLRQNIGEKYNPLKSFRIEGYDVSHTSGRNTYGVMSVLINGQPENSQYRLFKIKGSGKDKVDDIKNLAETLERRFNHREWNLPDLIVLDGGRAQVNIATRVASRHKLEIPIVSVVKNEKHKPREILGKQNVVHDYHREILLANSEAHRFALKHHRLARGKIVK